MLNVDGWTDGRTNERTNVRTDERTNGRTDGNLHAYVFLLKQVRQKGQKSKPKNYRPVSLTSVVCKCLEKIARGSVIEHLMKNHLSSNAQFGFRTGRSCLLQLIDMLEDWSNFVENDENWDTVYLDFAKAFDSVPHERLRKRYLPMV